jgi:hypothetical protein
MPAPKRFTVPPLEERIEQFPRDKDGKIIIHFQ